MAHIMDIPLEILETNLCDENITVKDFINFRSTCTYFETLVGHSNKIWKHHFCKRWPHLEKICREVMYETDLNFEELMNVRTKCNTQLRDFLTEISKKWFRDVDIYINEAEFSLHSHISFDIRTVYLNNIYIDEKSFDLLICHNNDGHPMNYYFLLDELTSILEKSKSDYKNELTYIYYCKKILPYLKHYHLKYVWKQFLKRPAKQQLLEEVVTLFAQWMQFKKDISYAHIEIELDNIVEQVMSHLKIECPTHPIFSAVPEQFSYWKQNNIDKDEWNIKDARQILDILCKVFSEELKFCIKRFHNTISSISLHYINQVFERKACCILLFYIIFRGVARRLGIYCELICQLDNSVLIWKPRDSKITESDETECFFIDVTSDNVITVTNIHSTDSDKISAWEDTIGHNLCNEVSPIMIMPQLMYCLHIIRIRNHLDGDAQIRWLFELQHMLHLEDMMSINQLYKYYSHNGISMSSLIPILETIIRDSKSTHIKSIQHLLRKMISYQEMLKLEEENQIKNKPKKNTSIKFKIGMIVTVICEQQLAGVIIGWNDKRIDIYKSYKCINNPFKLYYTVLCEDNRLHFVSEDYLKKIDKPRAINNSKIGKYFSEFKETHYVPNEMLLYQYPENASSSESSE